MRINALSIPMTNADTVDLAYVWRFVQQHAGFCEGVELNGPDDVTIAYFGLLRFVETVRLIEARGTEQEKRALAREFFEEQTEEGQNDGEDEADEVAEADLFFWTSTRARPGC